MFRVCAFMLLLLSCVAAGCQTGASSSAAPAFDTLTTGKVLDMQGRNDPSVVYTLYLPKTYNMHKPVPMVVLLDAHARMHSSLAAYIPICEKLHIAMICSGNSRNGLDITTTNTIVQRTIDDMIARVHTDSTRLYAAGFSGGARVSAGAALNDARIKGVIGCGAGLPDRTDPSIVHFPYILIAGQADMNATELYTLHKALTTPHGFIVFDGIHEWPKAEVMLQAINAMLKGDVTSVTNEDMLNKLFTQTALSAEDAQHPIWQQMFQQNKWDAILAQVNTMKAQIKAEKQLDIKAMDQRLLSYAGMMCFFAVPHAPDMDKALAVYAAIEPNNSDMWYFKAVYEAHKGNKDVAHADLQKAADNGYYDGYKLSQEPALQGIADNAIMQQVRNNN